MGHGKEATNALYLAYLGFARHESLSTSAIRPKQRGDYLSTDTWGWSSRRFQSRCEDDR
ncbi:hypothetical protein [aff. Roholtiella sp. LEGE 12411]|uniref:hypothetical protein n=1 Tax=aff. Roholtiella sp. LEGE 12411 TaxID=1828822 RepID=UPI0018804D08|nr:hypothetical protein [aff. Roholtiella sp. LEGE 12411]MBE9034318.1 hypothetical protein [aff. Roholtiella sp. LEGE 12411]